MYIIPCSHVGHVFRTGLLEFRVEILIFGSFNAKSRILAQKIDDTPLKTLLAL